MLHAIQSATIRQLLTLVYLIITAPAIAFVISSIYSIDRRIELAQNTLHEGDAFVTATRPKNNWLIDIGRLLREIGAPLAKSPKLDKPLAHNKNVALELSDTRAALIYIWLLIFLLGAGIIMWVGNRLNRPIDQLTAAVERLTRDDLVEPISIYGPKNIREMSRGIEQLRVRLKESDTLQTQFLRHISHEIKTPLTSIKEGSQLLEDELIGPINDEQREVTEILNKSTKELQSSIENLLSYNSAISVDKVKQRQTINLRKLVEEVLDKHALAVKKKRLNIVTDMRPARAFIDRNQILTVFDNLMSNAVKFSPEGGTVQLSVKSEDDRAVFIINDDGPGVPDKYRTAIFDAFFVGKQATQSTLKGTGLGLSIARQYVELHQGTIELMNTRKGAAFRVTFKR